MRQVLARAARAGRTTEGSEPTIRALVDRDLCDETGLLTPYGHVIAVSLLPLTQQCGVLAIPLEERELEWDGRPERAALGLLVGADRWGYADEGTMLHSLIHALVLPRLYSVMSKAWNGPAGYDRARSWLYRYYAGYNDILDAEPNLAAQMLNDVEAFDRSAFVESWRRLRDWNLDNQWNPHPALSITVTEALATLDAVGQNRLASIAGRIFSDPYAYYHGWPDLMVMDASERLTFWEVKTTDRLRAGQIITMMDMRDAAGLDMRVMRLKRPRGT